MLTVSFSLDGGDVPEATQDEEEGDEGLSSRIDVSVSPDIMPLVEYN